HFPVIEYVLHPWVVLAAFGVSGTAATLGTLGAVRRAVKLPPAVAMRPEPPASYRPTVIERLGLQRFVPMAARMVLRNLERRPARSLFSALGIAMATGILVLGNFSRDAIEHVLEVQYRFAQP